MIASMSAKVPSREGAVVSSARSGEPHAREALGRQVGRAAYLFALQLTGDREAALDIAQDSSLKFFKYLDRFDAGRPIEPWLYQIVRNRVRDVARRERLRRSESLDVWLEQGRFETADPAADPAEAAERSELQHSIWRAASQLSDLHREIFVLRDYHDLSYREIAEVLAIPPGTVMSRLHAARTRLRVLLRAQGEAGWRQTSDGSGR